MGNSDSRTPAAKPKETLDAILSGAELGSDASPDDDASAEDGALASLRARLGVLDEGGRLPSLAVMRHALNVQAGDFALIAQALADFATPEGAVSKAVFVDEVVSMLPDVHHEAVHAQLLARIFDALFDAGSAGPAQSAGGGGDGSLRSMPLVQAVGAMALFAHKVDSAEAARAIFVLIDANANGTLELDEIAAFAAIQMRMLNVAHGSTAGDVDSASAGGRGDGGAAAARALQLETARLIFAEMDLLAQSKKESARTEGSAKSALSHTGNGGGSESVNGIDLATWSLWFHDNIANRHLPTPPFDEMREIMNFAAGSLNDILGALDGKFELARLL